MLQKSFVCGPKIDPKYFKELTPEPTPTRIEKPGQT